jgi:hypothetical protein
MLLEILSSVPVESYKAHDRHHIGIGAQLKGRWTKLSTDERIEDAVAEEYSASGQDDVAKVLHK